MVFGCVYGVSSECEWCVDGDVFVELCGEFFFVPCELGSYVHGVDLFCCVLWVCVGFFFVGDCDVGCDDFCFVVGYYGGVLES